MAFLRFSRDKRGYEHFYLVEPVTNRRGKTRTRVLYWYRTPPNVRVGRPPFDEDAQRALEAQHPNVTFDWRKIIDAPIPSAEAEKWRERRRAEKAEKAARQLAARQAGGAAAGEADEAGSDEVDRAAAGEAVPGTREHPYRVTADQIRKKRRRRRGRGRSEEAAVAPTASTGDQPTAEPAHDAVVLEAPPEDSPGE